MKNKQEAEDAQKGAEAKNNEGEDDNKKDEFAKDGNPVDANKHNQALRKAREAEASKRELEDENKKLKDSIKNQLPKKEEGKEEGKKEEEGEDDFWAEENKEEQQKTEQLVDPDEIQNIINEKIRPFIESESQRTKVEKKKAREAFYDTHPEYLSDADKWAELLDEMNGSIVPSGDYYQDLEKAHRILGGEDATQSQIEQKKAEHASDAGTGEGQGSPSEGKGDGKVSAMDKKIMEGTDVSEETIKSMRKMQKDGTLSLEF